MYKEILQKFKDIAKRYNQRIKYYDYDDSVIDKPTWEIIKLSTLMLLLVFVLLAGLSIFSVGGNCYVYEVKSKGETYYSSSIYRSGNCVRLDGNKYICGSYTINRQKCKDK